MKSIKKANIIEVAKLANVSAMTVTRAFNGSAPVAEKTRKVIMDAARQLNYQPNFFAKTLRGEKTKSVGILWSLASPHTSVKTIRKMSLELMKNGYVSYLADSLSDPEIMKNVLSDYLNRSVDGLICQLPSSLASDEQLMEKLSAFPSKIIIIEKDIELQMDTIIHDRFEAMLQMAEHLAGTGRRKILILSSGPMNNERIEVFVKKLHLMNIETLQPKILSIKEREFIGQKFADLFSSDFPDRLPFDAVWCTCDEGAAAIMKVIKARGYSVPDDIAVIGFNDNEMDEYLTPPLASVQRFDEELVTSAVQKLLTRMSNPDLPLFNEKYSMKFVLRKSAGEKL